MFIDVDESNLLESSVNGELDTTLESSNISSLNSDLRHLFNSVLYGILIHGVPEGIKQILDNKNYLSLLASSKINTQDSQHAEPGELRNHIKVSLKTILSNSKINLNGGISNKLAESLETVLQLRLTVKLVDIIVNNPNIGSPDSLLNLAAIDLKKIKKIDTNDLNMFETHLSNLSDKDLEIVIQALSIFESSIVSSDINANNTTNLLPSFLNKNILLELINDDNFVTSNQTLKEKFISGNTIKVKYTRNYNPGSSTGIYSPIFR